MLFSFFFFNDTATTEIYTLSLHDALPISPHPGACPTGRFSGRLLHCLAPQQPDRKSTRLNSSHSQISYAVFCLKKKKKKKTTGKKNNTNRKLHNATADVHLVCYLTCLDHS